MSAMQELVIMTAVRRRILVLTMLSFVAMC
jgi:hypothetical protein